MAGPGDTLPEVLRARQETGNSGELAELERDVAELFLLSDHYDAAKFQTFLQTHRLDSAEGAEILRYYASASLPTADQRASSVPSPVREIRALIPPVFEDGRKLQAIHARPNHEWRQAKNDYYPAGITGLGKIWGVGALAAGAILWAEVARKLWEQGGGYEAGVAVATIFPALYLADNLQQVLHYKLDNEIREDHPWFGSLVRDFRIHHEIPEGITTGSYFGRISELAKVTLPGFLASVALLETGMLGKIADAVLAPWGVPERTIGPMVDTVFATGAAAFFFSSLHGTYSHQQAHTKSPPRFWRWLQKLRLVLPSRHHMRHHRPPFDENHSVLLGWADYGKGAEYWKAKHLRFWKKRNLMPGTWIQDLRTIPPEVADELIADYAKIPPAAWAYTDKAYPERVPAWLKAPLAQIQAKWRADFIFERAREYRMWAQTDPAAAEEKWRHEQAEYEWIYGPTPSPLQNAAIPTRSPADPGMIE